MPLATNARPLIRPASCISPNAGRTNVRTLRLNGLIDDFQGRRAADAPECGEHRRLFRIAQRLHRLQQRCGWLLIRITLTHGRNRSFGGVSFASRGPCRARSGSCRNLLRLSKFSDGVDGGLPDGHVVVVTGCLQHRGQRLRAHDARSKSAITQSGSEPATPFNSATMAIDVSSGNRIKLARAAVVHWIGTVGQRLYEQLQVVAATKPAKSLDRRDAHCFLGGRSRAELRTAGAAAASPRSANALSNPICVSAGKVGSMSANFRVVASPLAALRIWLSAEHAISLSWSANRLVTISTNSSWALTAGNDGQRKQQQRTDQHEAKTIHLSVPGKCVSYQWHSDCI